MTRKKTWILVAGIVALAFFLRIINIENAPPGVYPDEAVNGADALQALKTGNFQWFYPDNNGREGLFMNLIAGCFWLFGVSVFSLKLPSVIFGALTVFGTYLLSREIFPKARLALIASFLTAVSFWALNFSRISFRANMLPFVLVFTSYFFWKGLRTKKWSAFAWAGFFFGIGMHTYIAFRITPVIFFLTLLALTFSWENFIKEYWKKILIFGVFFLFSATPMFYTFYIHPEYLESRSASISILDPEVNQGDLLGTFARSLGLSLAKYNFWGDQNWRHNFPPYPILDPVTGIAFLFGIIYVSAKTVALFFQRFFRGKKNRRFPVYVFLFSWFFVMLAPEFMTAEGLPHALRAIGNLPVTLILASLTFEFLLRHADRHSLLQRQVTAFLIILILLSTGIFNTVKYHLVWAKKEATARSFESSLMEVSRHINNLPEKTEKFVVAENMQRVPIKVFSNQAENISYVYFGQVQYIEPENKKNFIVILTERNDQAFQILREKFPDLSFEEKKDRFGLNFYIMKTN